MDSILLRELPPVDDDDSVSNLLPFGFITLEKKIPRVLSLSHTHTHTQFISSALVYPLTIFAALLLKSLKKIRKDLILFFVS